MVHLSHAVLLVDDHADTRETFARVLGMAGVAVDVAASGAQALAMLADGLRPCIVLLDLHLGGMSEWGVWNAMQADAELASIPVVLLSADLPNVADAQARGVRDVLQTPVETATVLARIHEHCGRS